jgi:hypothetical protein
MATTNAHVGDQVQLSVEEKRKKDERQTVWVFLWTLFVFKIVTVAAIVWAAKGSSEANALIAVTTWPFLFLPAAAIIGPLLFYWRLRRVRAKRRALQRSEWMLDETG